MMKLSLSVICALALLVSPATRACAQSGFRTAKVDPAAVRAAGVPIISPAQATAIFYRQPGAVAGSVHYCSLLSEPTHPRSQLYYDVYTGVGRSRPGTLRDIEVDALSGVPWGATWDDAPEDREPSPVPRGRPIGIPAAVRIAEEWLARYYPAFERHEWQRVPDDYIDGTSNEYQCSWLPVYGPYRALGEVDVMVYVSRYSGTVTSFAAPPSLDGIGPVPPPNVSVQQALQIARRYAPLAPAKSPVSVRLWLNNYPDGIYHYEYKAYQRTRVTDMSLAPVLYINGYTANVLPRGGTFGGGRLKLRATPSAEVGVTVRAAGRGMSSDSGAVALQIGAVFVRLETLHNLGIVVRQSSAGVTLSANNRCVQVAVTRLNSLPFLPLRSIAQRLGWQIDWLPETRTALLTTDAISRKRAVDALWQAEQLHGSAQLGSGNSAAR